MYEDDKHSIIASKLVQTLLLKAHELGAAGVSPTRNVERYCCPLGKWILFYVVLLPYVKHEVGNCLRLQLHVPRVQQQQQQQSTSCAGTTAVIVVIAAIGALAGLQLLLPTLTSPDRAVVDIEKPYLLAWPACCVPLFAAAFCLRRAAAVRDLIAHRAASTAAENVREPPALMSFSGICSMLKVSWHPVQNIADACPLRTCRNLLFTYLVLSN
jgi:hypothetical protein